MSGRTRSEGGRAPVPAGDHTGGGRLREQDLIFLFGLPRSGTTLLQRILWQAPEVHTTPEPWLLLPLLQPLRSSGTRADYGYRQFSTAFNDLPLDKDAYRRAVSSAALELYGGMLPQHSAETRFLDKTPRYHLISEEILRSFPDSRAVVVWRNPLAVVASIMSTWNSGRWNLYNYSVDLYDGARALLETCRRYPNRLHVLRYEDLVQDPIGVCARLFRHIELDFKPSMVEQGTRTRLLGQMGDKTGQRSYGGMSMASLDKYRAAFSTPYRRQWARDYLDWLGPAALSDMGYSSESTYGALETGGVDLSLVFSDFLRRVWGRAVLWADVEGFRHRRQRRRDGLPPLRFR